MSDNKLHPQDFMLRITGYSDKFSVRPGEDIGFHVHSEYEESYQADIVRLIHGDTNPEGPGYKEELIHTSVSDMYPGKHQAMHIGGYIMVPHDERFNLNSFTMCAFIYPTTPVVDKDGIPVGVQSILSKWDAEQETGYGMFINEQGELCLKIGHGPGKVEEFSTGKPLFRKMWYKVAVSFDAATGQVKVFQRPYVTNTNNGHCMSMLHPVDDTQGEIEASSYMGGPAQNDCPFLMAASTEKAKSGRFIGGIGSIHRELDEPWEIPVHTLKYNGKIERPKVANRALAEHEIELLLSCQGIEHAPNELRESVIGAWDFVANIHDNAASQTVIDKSLTLSHGQCVNIPVRAVTGFNWSSDYMSFKHGPHEYGAIHFHDESVDDARWEKSFTLTVPQGLPSGVYAARLRVNRIASADTEDYIPFVVRPPKTGSKAKIALILPIFSYMAYANDNLSVNSVIAQLLTGQVPLLQPGDLLLNKERGYGLGTYAHYRDGWGVNTSSRLRPILNMRPKYIHVLSPSLWQLNADLHITDWLDEMGYDCDIHTDIDLQEEGVDLLKDYKCVLTGHHPEYPSEEMVGLLP
ncbi:Large subunit of N2CN-dimethylformamidase [gamma proteobacterium IMCC2047]|nr:Large subunit of N2CN-dimethylformamidase [gamma proteobacterium IMCC2047]